ncbi:josephin-like protein [Ricinus communis]|uniref:josephin-like protein n=1 Tax=Ricinus communis TaxID=3988 RepID=UPI00201AE21B|nr:josephin-like protein [Ricinus communis]
MSKELIEMASNDPRVYHERQRLQFCLLHALNNLFQQKDEFTRPILDAIAEKLVLECPDKQNWTPLSIVFKPHHNSLTGNYDINVLISALEDKGKIVVWHDRRNGASSIDLDDDNMFGIVLNVHVRRYAGLWKSRHWVALRKISGIWYNLDSDLHEPSAFQDVDEVRGFLDYVIGQGGEILLVMNKKE